MKKKILIPVVWVTVSAVLIVLFAAGIAGAFRYGFVEGRVLIADNGEYLIILDDRSPIRMSDRSRQGGLFGDLQTGDKIRIVHDGIEESYPGRTRVYSVRLIEKGSIEDISEDVLRSLAQIGLLGAYE